MKKIIAVAVVLILCLTAFAACSGEVITNTVNWQESETLEYDIRVVDDFAVLIGDAPTKNVGDYLLMPADADQIKPYAAHGTYTTSVSKAAGENLFKVTTTLRLRETYLREDLTADFIAALQAAGFISAETATQIEIATEIDAVVTYNYYGLIPVESQRTVRGAYVGSKTQEINDYTLTMKYTATKNYYNCEATLTDKVKPSRSFTETYRTSGLSGFYDNEMLFYVARSFTLSQITSAAGTAAFIDPIGAQTQIALGFGAATGLTAYVGGDDAEDVTRIIISTGGTAIVMFVSPTDTVTVNQAPRLSNKILKFQQGYLVFTIK